MKVSKKTSTLFPCLIIILFILIIWGWIFYLYKNKFFRSSQREFYQNLHSDLANPGIYPFTDIYPLLEGEYPLTNRQNLTNDGYNNIWFYFPIFGLGSYDQITNNLRYRYNPDDGQCVTADFCGSLYKNKKVKSNVSQPLPPVNEGKGARVNYYRNKENILL